MSSDFDYLTQGIKEVENLNKHRVFVGSLLATGNRTVEYNQMIAEVQNNGAVIHPVTRQWLTIPMPVAGKRTAREINGLFWHVAKSGQKTLARNENGKLVVYFLLTKEVKLPARPFIDVTAAKNVDKIANIVANGVADIYLHKTTAGQIFDQIGKFLSIEMKREMVATNEPMNAKITQNNKGFNNPLLDTGALQRSITWVVI